MLTWPYAVLILPVGHVAASAERGVGVPRWVAAHFGRLGRAAPERLWEEDRDGDGLISRAEFSGPQGRVPRAWPLLAELERTAGAGAWLSARQMGARRMSALSETTGSFATPPL